MKALSIRQPWVDAILYGDKRIENRTGWRNCSYRGAFLLHASKGMKRDDWLDCDSWVRAHHRGIDWRPRHELFDDVRRGVILGVAYIVDVIFPGGVRRSPAGAILGPHARANDRWYMGGFALVLDELVHEWDEPVPCKGKLGLFEVPEYQPLDHPHHTARR